MNSDVNARDSAFAGALREPVVQQGLVTPRRPYLCSTEKGNRRQFRPKDCRTTAAKQIPRTHVQYPDVVTERPRIALRQPRSLQPEQLGQLTACTPAVPHEGERMGRLGGRRRGTRASSGCRLDQESVRVRIGAQPHQDEVWVWAGAVERA
jgi:hypothetical protein